ncbi:MAG: T9SS type A sorting domain-containing protein [Bacteroidota bacterium]|nr:T9SS type A sorting domain-containing protein [Bacteroidota bacterium]
MNKVTPFPTFRSYFKVLILVVFLLSGNKTSIAQILTFDFAGIAGSEVTYNSNFNHIDLTSSTISRGSGLTTSANADRFNATDWAITAGVDLNDYMSFTVTPNSGFQFSVSSVVVQMQRSGTGPRVIELRSSVDGYVGTLGTAEVILDLTTTQTFTFTFTQSNSTAPITYRVYMYNSEAAGGTGGIGDAAGDDIVVNGVVSTISPTITLSPSTLSSFTYVVGTGPSSNQTFNCSGVNLTGNILITPPANYEISLLSGSGFGSAITLTPTSGSIAATPIFVRLKAGLPIGTYNSELIACSSAGAATKNVVCNGSVTSGVATVFGTGDIAIVGMCVNMLACGGASGEDEISFVSFEDITPGTSIDLTENGFERKNCGSNTWGNSEGVVRITRTTSTVPKGTIVTLRILDESVFTPIQPDGNWTVSYPNTSGTFNLNGNDEQVYIMQGGTWATGTAGLHNATYTGGILMFAINTFTSWSCNDNLTTRGNLPSLLKCFSILPGIATANIKYTGPVTPASQKDWVDRLNSSTNWSGTSTCALYTAGGLDYGGTSQVYSIIASGFNAGQWTGASNTDWFDCNNWQNYKIPDATTNVAIDQTAVNNCVVGVTTGAAVCSTLALSSNNATTRNLTVNNTSSLSVSGNATISKTVTSANLAMTVLNTGSFSCNNLTITGTASGFENGRFINNASTTSVTINGNLTLNTGAQLDLSTAGTMQLKGNYTNNGLESDFKESGSTIFFNGTGAQSISTNSFNEVFANIVLNKASNSLTLNNPIEMINNFNFTSGLINTFPYTPLIFRDGSTYNNASSVSYANGTVRKIGDDAFTFPVGKGGQYAPASITAPATLTDVFTAEYFYSNPDPTYDNTSKDATINNISVCEYWTIDRTEGTSDVSVTLTWGSPRSCGVGSLIDLVVARWNGTMWKDHGNGGTTGTTAAGTVISAAVITSFSPFTLGSVTALNPLPIELLSFTASATDEKTVTLNWSTATEINNDFFTIERSADGVEFEFVQDVNAAGNSDQLLRYETIDPQPIPGLSYYRLKQTDYNGATSFSAMAPVEFRESGKFIVYPNPASHTIQVITGSEAKNSFEILSVQGKFISGSGLKNPVDGRFTLDVSELAPGPYILKVVNAENIRQHLFIKQ